MPREKILNCKCKVCGEEFYAKPSHIEKRGAGKYCSMKCKQADSYTSKMCEHCGKEFIHIKSTDRKFCSNECKLNHLHNTLTVKEDVLECKYCGELFSPKRVNQVFCSLECSHKSQRNQLEIKCNVCGKLFLRKNSLVGNINVCSEKCLKTHQSIKMKDNKYLKGYKHLATTKLKISETWKMKLQDVNFRSKWAKGFAKEANRLETYFNDLTPNSVKFTGNGKFFLTFKDGTIKNPDFVVEHSRKVIELYGDYWHKNDDPQELIKAYNQIGFECLVFWESEVYNNTQQVLENVLDFIQR